MNTRWLSLAILFLAPAAMPAQDPPGPEGPPLEVPEGFVVERVAGPPLVERPVMASFDDHGRLYVIDSAGVNVRGSELLKDPPHRIRLLEDSQGTGVFDKSSVWADKLVFPAGLLWHEGAVYCTSPPSFWKLEDTRGAGVCDKRTELLTGMAVTGVADDAHGACLGPDGRLYFMPARMGHHLRTPDGRFTKNATGPWLMRCKTDGSEMEIVCGTQGNPVEVDWLPEGDFFVSGTFWAPDSYGGGLRDALIHGVEGGEYSVRDRVYSDRKRTGDFLPVLVPMIATAPAGMTVYRSGAFGPSYKGNLFCSYFNLHKVQRHILIRDGASFRAKTEDFVWSKHPDFHPTDVHEDADGSLLVVDTGGWFRIGCPTSQIAKPQVLGGIYRVRRKEAVRTDPRRFRGLDLDLAKLPPGELAGRLAASDSFTLRERIIEELARRGSAGVAPLAGLLSHPSAQAALDAVWALTRIEDPGARAAVRTALVHALVGVRQAAATSAGLHRDPEAAGRLKVMVVEDQPQVRREAATALGRMGDRSAVPALLQSLRVGGDRFLEHALIFALIRLSDREDLVAALGDSSASVKRAALIALDQMDEGHLTPELVTPLLDPLDAALQQAAVKVFMSHAGWSGQLFGVVRQWLHQDSLPADRQDLLKGVLVSFSRDPAMQDLMARSLRDEKLSESMRLLLLESMARALPEKYPTTWLAEARWALEDPSERVVRQALAVLRLSACADFDEAILRIAREEARSEELRVEAGAAVAARLPKLEGQLFQFFLASLDREKAPLLRLSAAEAVGKAPLNEGQLGQLAGVVSHAGPLELPRLIGAFAASRNGSTGKKLLQALRTAPGFPSLSAEVLRRVLKEYPEDTRREAEPLLKNLEVDTAQMKATLDSMASVLERGDERTGRDIFFGKKAGCTACHTVAGQGGKVGPDLSKIGSIRVGRDLLEAIVFPSATFARGYEPYLIRTKSGEIFDGLISRETPDALYLFTADRVEKRISRGSIEVIQQGKVSIMPQGLDRQISREELRDLITFLTSLR